MHIRFSRLILHNFMSFGDVDLRFDEEGFIRVSGQNDNPLDNAKSNGSGKSSLWEALVWAITGETIRGTKNIVNVYGTDGAVVDLEFYIDENRYQIIRSKDHSIRKTSLQILINGEDVSGKGIRDSEKILSERLPDITASLLGSVIVLGQGLPQKFTSNTPSGRKEVLEKLSKSDFMIEDLKERVQNRKTDLIRTQRSFEDTLTSCRSKVSVLQHQIDRDMEALKTLDRGCLEHDLHVIDAERNEILDDVIKYKKEISEIEVQVSLANDTLFDLNNETNNQLDALKDSELAHTIQERADDINKLKQEKYALEAELRTKLNIKDVCPTCGQKLPDVVKPDVSGTQKALEEISFKLDCANDEFSKLSNQHNSLVDEVKRSYTRTKTDISDSIITKKANLQVLKEQLSKKEARLSTLNSQYSDIQNRLSYIDSSIQTLKNNISQNQDEIKSTEEEILYNNMQKDLTQSHLDVLNKFDTALKRDFRGYLLSTVISYIETRAKYYSNIIFDTDNIKFCLDGNNIDISYMNRPYENLSGGEKQKIDLIIQFSIRDMLSTQLGFTSNILVLDEVFDSLDSTGCDRVIDMIASLSDIKNIFIVTHRKDLSIPCDRELVVVKSSVGISSIQGH